MKFPASHGLLSWKKNWNVNQNNEKIIRKRKYLTHLPFICPLVLKHFLFLYKGLSGSTSRLHQSSTISSYATLRRDRSKERPKSALERLYSGDHQRGKMSAEEQLERMKRHQKALVRERKRTLSQGERQSVSSRSFIRPISADIGSVC